jgi:uncharacterized protein (TIGR03435 family)
MSDRIFSWLLRLYPPSFRKEYAEEAHCLYQARLRDETGFVLRSRLYCDLLADLIVGLRQAYRNSYAGPAASLALNGSGPSFAVLEQEPLRPASILGGSVLALAVVAIFAFVMTSPIFLPAYPSAAPMSPIEFVMQRVNAAMSADSTNSAQSQAAAFHLGVAAGLPAQPSTAAAATSSPRSPGAALADSEQAPRASEVPSMRGTEKAGIGSSAASPKPQTQSGASQPASAKRPLAFEVISIRRNTGTSGPPQFGATPDGYRQINMPLFAIFQEAYAPPKGNGVLDGNRIAGGPDWLTSEKYDVVAKVSEADLADWQKPELKQTMLRTMLQSMLADRCQAVVHDESKEVPVYDLVVAKGGPKFKPAVTADPAELRKNHPGGGSMIGGGMAVQNANGTQFYGVSMAWLAQTMLPHMAGRPVVDKTGLTGPYDLMLPPLALPPPPPPPGGRAIDAPSPPTDDESIFTALPEALGLRLEPAKGQVETLVIDHVERPSEN